MKKQIIGLLAVALLAGAGCSKKLADTGSYFHSGSEYLNSEGDGSITVRAYGMGKTREDAIEQACKNAVRDVLFKGVQTPENTILSRPLIREINAEEKYQYFFNPFFADGGAYRRSSRARACRRRRRAPARAAARRRAPRHMSRRGRSGGFPRRSLP